MRLGKDNESWALATAGISPMQRNSKAYAGWVRADLDACQDERLRAKLLHHAIRFVATLPAKP